MVKYIVAVYRNSVAASYGGTATAGAKEIKGRIVALDADLPTVPAGLLTLRLHDGLLLDFFLVDHRTGAILGDGDDFRPPG